MEKAGNRFLTIYAGVLTAVVATAVLTGFTTRPKKTTFDEIEVHRINVVEPDGTLRMIISNHDRLPGIISHGKEKAFARPQAGMLFFNDEASETGGLIFGGRKNERGEVVDAGGSLSFDRYGANQIVQLIGVHDSEDRFAGLTVTDSLPGGPTRRRLWAGRTDDGSATVALMDAEGRKRIVMRVGADGAPSLAFLDESGKVTKEIASTPP